MSSHEQVKKLLPPSQDFDELIKQEKKRRNDLIQNSTSTERKTKIYIPGLYESPANIPSIHEAFQEEVAADTTQDYDLLLAKKFLSENTTNDKFKLRARGEYEKLINSKVYTKAVIRIKFPNEILIEGNFALMETIGDIYKFVKDNLVDPELNFYLTTSPPLKKYTDMKKTIFYENLAPSSIMYITFPSIDPQKEPDHIYLKKESVEKYLKEL
jgi:tether containing UBX domain for GLUT4